MHTAGANLPTPVPESAMKAPGLALVLLGAVAFVLPVYRDVLPYIPLRDFDLHLTAAGMFLAGGLMLFLLRNS